MERLRPGDKECAVWKGYACLSPCPMANFKLRHEVELDVIEPPSYKVAKQRGIPKEELLRREIAKYCSQKPNILQRFIDSLRSG